METLSTMYEWHRCPRLLFQLVAGKELVEEHRSAIGRALGSMQTDGLLKALRVGNMGLPNLASRIILLEGKKGQSHERAVFTTKFNGIAVEKVQ